MSDGSDDENKETQKPFCVERAKQGRAKCKKCKQNCLGNELRIAKVVLYNPFGGGIMKQWHHVDCIFDQFFNQRLTTKRIENSDDIDGWDDLDEDDKEELQKCIEDSEKKIAKKFGIKYSPKKPLPKTEPKPKTKQKTPKKDDNTSVQSTSTSSITNNKDHKDNLFREFRRLVAEVTNESSYLEKTSIMNKMFTKGSDGTGFKGDVILWVRLLIPGVIKRIYNLKSKQLVKLFSSIFETNREEMMEHLEQGDIGETIQHFFDKSNTVKPTKKSLLTIQDVDNFLEELSNLTKEEEQMRHFKKMLKKCTSNELKIIIRLIKQDLRMNAGAKHVLDAVHADAYSAFQSSRDLTLVLKRFLDDTSDNSGKKNKDMKVSVKVMTPVLPMLAEACKSVEQAMKKCPNGMYSEIKYDGERVQVHKHGSEFKYFSRSLKPVLPHKVNHFKEYIPQAFPHAKDLILDSEVLLIDTNTGKPLPFGSLGVHKKEEFKDANVCLFVFDCIYYNGESLTHKPIRERRAILKDNMIEIKNHIMFSEMEEINRPKDLAAMIAKVLSLGLEGLVLKDLMSIYEPGKRHWLKVKKDYLLDGAMADAADLIVLGAWYGTGKKGGMMSVFLMGCYDKHSQKFCTVTKVHTGHDDKTLEQLQNELDMVKISCEVSKVPSWLKCTKTMVPDFVARDPKKQPVWEITGAEFTQHEVHTANGISIRFPRVTKIRNDKTWENATTLEELKTLFKNSKENTDYSSLLKTEYEDDHKPDIKKYLTEKKEVDEDEKEDKKPEKRKSLKKEIEKEETDEDENKDKKTEKRKLLKKENGKEEIEEDENKDKKPEKRKLKRENEKEQTDEDESKDKKREKRKLLKKENRKEEIEEDENKDKKPEKRKLKKENGKEETDEDEKKDKTEKKKLKKENAKEETDEDEKKDIKTEKKKLEKENSKEETDEDEKKDKTEKKLKKENGKEETDEDEKKDIKTEKKKLEKENSKEETDEDEKNDKTEKKKLKKENAKEETDEDEKKDIKTEKKKLEKENSKEETDEDEKKDIKTEKRKLKKENGNEEEEPPTKKNKTDNNHKIRYPSIFTNVKLWPLPEVKETNEALLRNFIACDGELLDEDQLKTATHVVHNEDIVTEKEVRNNFPNCVKHITIDWIKDSIGNNELLDTRPYAVTWT